MPFNEWRAELRTLLKTGNILEDKMVQSYLRNVSAMRADINRLLSESGLYSINKQARLMAELQDIVTGNTNTALRDVYAGLDSAYLTSVASLDKMVMAFQTNYPFAVGVMDDITKSFTLNNTIGRVVLVTDEMKGQIFSAVQSGLFLNQRPFEVMNYLTNVMGIRSGQGFAAIGATGITAKAERIVRTETMTALNMGFHDRLKQAAQQFPDMKKIWLASGDWRTRDSHLDAHGQVVAWDDLFSVGGETCVMPLDPTLSARERVNCRCRGVPYRDEWGPVEDFTKEADEQVALERTRRAGDEIGKKAS